MATPIAAGHRHAGGADRPLLRSQMPELDMIRGLAVLSVFLFHAFFWSGASGSANALERRLGGLTQPGWLGVDLFFVLSGFLITGRLLNQNHLASRQYYRSFYLRRAFRILPLYYLVLAVVGGALLRVGETTPQFLAVSAAYAPNIAMLIGWGSSYPLGVLWSLGIEEQAYLVWPLVVHRASSRRLVVVFAGLCVVEPALRYLWFGSGLAPEAIWSATWLRLDGLAWGALLAVVVRGPLQERRRLAVAAFSALAVAVGLAVVGAGHGALTRRTAIGAALQLGLADLGFAALVALALVAGSARPTANGGATLRYFGRISYALYLVHQFVFWTYDRVGLLPRGAPAAAFPFLVRATVVLAVSLAVAELSRRYIEGPCLALKVRFT